jgi:hypothetical protein
MSLEIRIVSIIITLIFSSCYGNNRNKENELFIAKYGSDNFQAFKNRSFTLRGFDRDNNPIILVYDRMIDTGICRFPYRVIVNKKSGSVISSNRDWTDSTHKCLIDEKSSRDLATRFNDYGIAHLFVDSNDNVYIKVNLTEGPPDLLRISGKSISKELVKGWKRINGNWYTSLNHSK